MANLGFTAMFFVEEDNATSLIHQSDQRSKEMGKTREIEFKKGFTHGK